MTSEEDILKEPDLVARIIDEVHKEFYGEEDSIMALIVSITTRLVKECNAESRNIVVSEMSGAGKDKLVKTLCNIMLEPEVTYYHRSKLTPEVFTYWNNQSEFSWECKVIHVEDPQPDLLDCQGFKTMASGEKSATIVIKQKAYDIKIEGKPNLIITSYEGCANIEGVRRYPFIHLNTDRELTKQVKEGISRKYAKETKIEYDTTLRKALNLLKPYKVVIPYATQLSKYFPSDLVVRTYYGRFLDYICASAVLHQYQREKDKDGDLIATLDDYELARIAFLKTTNKDTMMPLNREQENLLDVLINERQPMFVTDIHKRIAKGRDWIYRNLEVLKRYKLVEQSSEFKEDANKEVTTYEYSGCRGLSEPIRLPPTGRLSGCRGCLWVLKNIDEMRKKKGLDCIYSYYYNTTNTTIQAPIYYTTTTTLQPPYNQNNECVNADESNIDGDTIKYYTSTKEAEEVHKRLMRDTPRSEWAESDVKEWKEHVRNVMKSPIFDI